MAPDQRAEAYPGATTRGQAAAKRAQRHHVHASQLRASIELLDSLRGLRAMYNEQQVDLPTPPLQPATK